MGVTRKERLLKAMLNDNAEACCGGVTREERIIASVSKKVCDNDALEGGGNGGGGSGGGEAFYIMAEGDPDNGYTIDKSFAEIEEAYNSGKSMWLKAYQDDMLMVFPLLAHMEGTFIFCTVMDGINMMYTVFDGGAEFMVGPMQITLQPLDLSVGPEQSVVYSGDESVTFDIAPHIYPVGSVYMNTGNVNPKSLFGGTWESVATNIDGVNAWKRVS